MWDSESESAVGQDYSNGPLNSSKQDVKTDGFERRDQSWHVATDIPSDLLVQVRDFNFHLHKYPLLSRSGRMNRIIYASRETDLVTRVNLDDLPGGPDAFELAAKFCYGIAIDLTAGNISGLRCTAEYLEMTEDLDEGNLIFKTEAFLSYVVLSSWRDSILVLKSCEQLSPWAENLQIVRRCSESIAWKACANPRGIRWAYTGKATKISSPKWNEKETSPSQSQPVPLDWWFEDVSILRIDHFVRVITAIKVKGMRFELIGAAIMSYATKWLLGLVKDSASGEEAGNGSSSNTISNKESSWRGGGLHMMVAGIKEEISGIQMKEQRMIVESLISIIPPQKDSVSCSFLLKLLRIANMLKVAPALVTELEKRVGMQFEQANLADLMIPSYNSAETLYDVDLVQRLLEHFLVQEQTEPSSPSRQYEGSPRINAPNAKMRVAMLIDSYLTEVSRDRDLSLTKFQVLAEALPESARTCDDGLYRAIDSYLKAHPTLSEHERKRLCRVMDCHKLSIDACMHAAQNERLPLRVVVQVLFSEQVKISNAIANNPLKEMGESYYQPVISTRKTLLEGTPQSFQEGWTTAKKDINTLKFELENMKAKYLEIQSDMENLQRQFQKISKPKHASAWTSGWKKLSKLTKMSGVENQEIGPQETVPVEQVRKPRRWRNSIS